MGDAAALLAGQLTCDLQVAGSSPVSAPLRSGLGKLLTPVCLCHQAVIFGTGQGGDLFGWEIIRDYFLLYFLSITRT